MRKLAIPLIISLVATTACWPFSTDDIAEMSVKRTSDSGKVEIVRGDETIAVSDAEEVKVGDLVSTSDGARALLRLEGEKPDSRFVNIAPNTDLRIQSTKAVEGPLHTGSLVADAGAPTRVTFAGFDATTASGAFRVDIGAASVRAGAYSGEVRLETPGQPRISLDRLFEAQAAAGDLDGKEPYDLDTADAWDRVFLRAVVDLDEQLTPLATGLRNQLDGARPGLPYFRALADQNVSFMKRYLSRPPVDLLTAFLIADNSPGSLKKNFVRAFRLADDGAKWAVAAGILDAGFKTFVADLSNVAAATGAVAGGTGNEAVFSVAAAEAIDDAAPGETLDVAAPPESDDGGGEDVGGGGGGDDGGGDDGTEPSPEPSEGGCGPICQTGNEVTERIPGARPSPTPSGILGGDVLRD
jgi:hypothetical protein